MKFPLCAAVLLLLCVDSPVASAQEPPHEAPLYELRVYQPTEGKQGDLLDFMSRSGMRLAKSNGLDIIAAFTPVASDDDRIVTLVRHEDRAACDGSYERMMSDPATRDAFQTAFPAGPPLRSLTRLFLKTTDYSPKFETESNGSRVFELRTYIASPGNLDALNSRFRDHTMKLFERHGMTNGPYWNVDEGDGTKAVELLEAVSPRTQASAEIDQELAARGNTLVYFLAHSSPDAAKISFDAFRKDPEWNTVRTASESKAGGSLTAGGGVRSWFLQATDFSPLQ